MEELTEKKMDMKKFTFTTKYIPQNDHEVDSTLNELLEGKTFFCICFNNVYLINWPLNSCVNAYGTFCVLLSAPSVCVYLWYYDI